MKRLTPALLAVLFTTPAALANDDLSQVVQRARAEAKKVAVPLTPVEICLHCGRPLFVSRPECGRGTEWGSGIGGRDSAAVG